MSDNIKNIGVSIKRLRKNKGLSLEQLGRLCGCSKSYLSRLETGQRRIDVDRLQCIALHLDVEPDYFFRSSQNQDQSKPAKKTKKTIKSPSTAPALENINRKVYEVTFRFEGADEVEREKVANIANLIATTSGTILSPGESSNKSVAVIQNPWNKILIVDDKPFIIEFIKDALETYGFKLIVDSAKTCAEALEKFKDHEEKGDRFSLVLLDYIGIKGSGKDTLTAMLKLNSRIPVIAMTGHGNRDIRQAALNEGAFDFIEKPISLHELMKSVQRALKLPHLPNVLQQSS
ncbi:MAG: response regulator [Pseudomonadota bacterium]